jgi:hypothetical protein
MRFCEEKQAKMWEIATDDAFEPVVKQWDGEGFNTPIHYDTNDDYVEYPDHVVYTWLCGDPISCTVYAATVEYKFKTAHGQSISAITDRDFSVFPQEPETDNRPKWLQNIHERLPVAGKRSEYRDEF